LRTHKIDIGFYNEAHKEIVLKGVIVPGNQAETTVDISSITEPV